MDAVWGTIVVALISGLCVAIPSVIATISSNKAHDQVVDEKMKNMTEQIKGVDIKIDKYAQNSDEMKERLIIVEQKVDNMYTNVNERRLT